MKKIFNYTVLLLSAFMLCLTGCKQEELIFDHERQQMETKADAILLEFIAPAGSALDEVIYITGAFSDGKKFQLEKTKNDKKWGIYLYAEDFQNGKTLKDGFTFVSEKNGLLYTIKGAPDTCYTDITYGQWTNVWGYRWESQFKTDEPDDDNFPEVDHDGDAFYVCDQAGWGAMTLYMWGDVNNLDREGGESAGWPGLEPTGKVEYRGNTWYYFDMGAVNAGKNENLIFNNNGGGAQTGDYNVTLGDGDVYYLVLAADLSLTAIKDPKELGGGEEKFPTIKHDGQDIVFVADNAKWGDMTLYMWGDVNNLDRDGGEGAGWPGLTADGSFEFKGLKWYYFLMGAANEGKSENMIFNNNGGGSQTGDIGVVFGAGEVYYYMVNEDKSVETIEDPNTYEFPSPEPEPTPDPEPGRVDTVIITLHDSVTTHLYFVDHSTNMHYVYAWGTYELFGGWMAGDNAKWADWESVTFLGQTFHHYAFKAEAGNEFNLIIANKGYADLAEADQKQYDAFTVKVGESTDLFYEIYDDHATRLVPTAAEISKIRLLLRK